MVNRILAVAILCAGTVGGAWTAVPAAADDASALELTDTPQSDEALKQEAATPPQADSAGAAGVLPPSAMGQTVTPDPTLSGGTSSTLSAGTGTSAISTLSATVSGNGFQN